MVMDYIVEVKSMGFIWCGKEGVECWIVAPKRYVHLEPQNVTASGIKVFVDIIKDLEMRSSHIMVGPTSSEECFL